MTRARKKQLPEQSAPRKARVVKARSVLGSAAAIDRNLAKAVSKDLAGLLLGIRDDAQYAAAQSLWRELAAMPEPRPESRRLLMRLLAERIDAYGREAYPTPDVPNGAAGALLRHLMAENGLRQRDLPEIGSQGVVSELVNGKREFTLRHIKALSTRFNVPVDAFI